MTSVKDALLGRIAVERGLISQTQLDECMREQRIPAGDPNQTIGRSSGGPPLGVVLLSKGYIQNADLITLLEEQKRRIQLMEEYRGMLKAELLFGQHLVRNNKATQIQINKCLEIQQQVVSRGVSPIPRLGELLVEHGYIDKQTVQEILRIQDKEILFCTGCSRQFNVVGVVEGMTYRCKSCGGLMVPKSMLDSLKVDETNFESEIREGPTT